MSAAARETMLQDASDTRENTPSVPLGTPSCKQPVIRIRRDKMSPRTKNHRSPTSSTSLNVTDDRSFSVDCDHRSRKQELKGNFSSSVSMFNFSPNISSIGVSTSNNSTASRISELLLDDASPAKRERASSASSIESFKTSYEPSDVTAIKLKVTFQELSAAQHSLKLVQDHAVHLESKLESVASAKKKVDQAHLDECTQLRAAAIESKIAHKKVTHVLKFSILALEGDMKEATRRFGLRNKALSDTVEELGNNLSQSEATRIQDAKKFEDEIAALQFKIESRETYFTEEIATLVKEIEKLQTELDTVKTAAEKGRETYSNKISVITSELESSVIFRDHLLESSSQLRKNNDCLLERLKGLETKLDEAENVGSSTPVQLSQQIIGDTTLCEQERHIQNQFEQIAEEREANKQEIATLRSYAKQDQPLEMNKLLDELQELKKLFRTQANTAEVKNLQTKILALENARDIEVTVASYLFEENGFYKDQVCALQSENQKRTAQDPRHMFEQCVLELIQQNETAITNNDLLTTQLAEVKKLTEFTKEQVLRLEQDILGYFDVSELIEYVKDNQTSPEKDEAVPDASLQVIPEDNARFLSRIDNLKIFLAKKQESQESYQRKLADAESTSLVLEESLKAEKLAHDSTKQELTSAEMKMQLQAAAIETNIEKISELEDRIELEQPLVQAGIRARQLWWELSKRCKNSNGQWTWSHRNAPNWQIVNSAEAKPDSAADNALFVLGILSSPKDRSTYKRIYRSPVQSDARKVVLSKKNSEVLSMAATLRNRCRIRANFGGQFTDSDQFQAMEAWCQEEFIRKKKEAGVHENSTRAEKRAVRDAFDNDATVKTYVLRMKEIFESAMEDFRNPR